MIACEESQVVCKAFRDLGHFAFSCDIVPCSGGRPEWHIQGDCSEVLNGNCSFVTETGDKWWFNKEWDLIIAHPPCTDLAVSGARWFAEKRKDGRQQRAIDFFMMFTDLNCERVAIEILLEL